ncbi:MAG: formylglycine-generating enzyme family protein [Bacteroidales bacterium]|nr:formylglycine-generating enzyme family protein [Bacteroidales bacterium]
MVYVSGGSFMMGSDDSDASPDVRPAHRVTLDGFRIGRYEVTQELWEAVMGNNPSYFKGSRRPVENVSWDDCQTFIRRLNSLTGHNFKLPTEAQWEFAARGGNSSNGYKYSGSNYIDNVAWYEGNSGGRTHNVGTKSPNELGIYDMSGNVFEYCDGEYEFYDRHSKIAGDFTRVARGGGWFFDRTWQAVFFRDPVSSQRKSNNYGFRLCL